MRGCFLTTIALIAALAGCSEAPVRQGGIVSTNPCADAMLVELAPHDRINAISAYSKNPASSSIPAAVARRFDAVSGTAEEVVARHPDLVVTSTYTPLATRDAYRRAGLKVLLLDSPNSVRASEEQVLRLAGAIGYRARGIAMVRRIEDALASARPSPGDRRRPSTLLYLSGDLVSGAGTLLDEVMRRTGLTDAAAAYGLQHTGALPLETIIDDPPDLILTPDLAERPSRLRAEVLKYRSRIALFPHDLTNCGGPVIARAATRLAAIRHRVLDTGTAGR